MGERTLLSTDEDHSPGQCSPATSITLLSHLGSLGGGGESLAPQDEEHFLGPLVRAALTLSPVWLVGPPPSGGAGGPLGSRLYEAGPGHTGLGLCPVTRWGREPLQPRLPPRPPSSGPAPTLLGFSAAPHGKERESAGSPPALTWLLLGRVAPPAGS